MTSLSTLHLSTSLPYFPPSLAAEDEDAKLASPSSPVSSRQLNQAITPCQQPTGPSFAAVYRQEREGV